MISLRRLKNSILTVPIHTVTARYFSAQSPTSSPNAIPSSDQYDDLINVAGRKGDFATVRRLLSERLSHGCFNTINTFKFIATNISVLDDLLQSLAALDGDWFTRKHAHDALVNQLAKMQRTAEALRVAGIMTRKRYGATAATFHPIINVLAHKKEISAAWHVVDAMRACDIKPDPTSFNYILTAYCYAGDVDSAAEMVAKMEAEGMKANAITYDALVLGACRAGRADAALAVMRRMLDEGMQPLSCSHVHIIKEMVARGYYTPAIEYVRIFAGKDEKLDAENFGYLGRRLRHVKKIEEAKSVEEEMVKRGLTFGGDW